MRNVILNTPATKIVPLPSPLSYSWVKELLWAVAQSKPHWQTYRYTFDLNVTMVEQERTNVHIESSLNHWDLIISEGILNLSWMTLGSSETKDGLIINKEVQK